MAPTTELKLVMLTPALELADELAELSLALQASLARCDGEGSAAVSSLELTG